MGILGLTTFMDNNTWIFEKVNLHDTKVVIDGNNLYHFIFFKYKVDFVHGGDYDQFAIRIKEFFSILHACNIQPYVVIDGGYEQDDRKFQTIHARMQQRLEMAMRLAKGHQEKLMPILAYETFRSVLLEIGVPFAVCDFEADKEIGKLANQFECPVLSNDSDFYILPLTAGFIPFGSVELVQKSRKRSGKKGFHYLSAKCYNVNNFAKYFRALEMDALPLFAALLGNDYVERNTFQSFFSSPGFRFCRGQLPFNFDERQTKMRKLIIWLMNLHTYDDGIDRILSTASTSGEKKSMLSAITKTKEAYSANETSCVFSLYAFFAKNITQPHIPESIRGYNGSSIPSWFICCHRQGNLPQKSLDIITLHRTFLRTQLEDPESKSSYQYCIKLRKYLYGILLSDDVAVLEKHNRLSAERKCGVEEYDRDGDHLGRNVVLPDDIAGCYGNLPKLSEIPDLPSPDREQLFRFVLDIPALHINRLSKELEIVLGIILFWIKNVQQNVKEYHLRSVLLCLIMLKIESYDTHDATGYEHDLIDEAILSMPVESKNEVSARLLRYCQSKENQIDSHLIHGFAQLQTCLLTAIHLNYILLCPFPNPCISRIFSGTFLYNFCLDLQRRRSPDLFIYDLLSKDSDLANVYQGLYDALMTNSVSERIFVDSMNKKRIKPHEAKNKKNEVRESGGKKQNKVRIPAKEEKKAKTRPRDVVNCSLTNRFNALTSCDESADENEEN